MKLISLQGINLRQSIIKYNAYIKKRFICYFNCFIHQLSNSDRLEQLNNWTYMGLIGSRGIQQTIYHRTLGWISLIIDDQSKYLIHRASIMKDQNYLQWQQRLKDLQCQPGVKKTLFLPLSINTLAQSSFCSGYDCYELIYENFQKTLNEDIEQNKIKANLYSEYKIIKILAALAKAGNIFQKKGYRMGIINDKNILFNEKQEIKIVTDYSSPIFYSNVTNNTTFTFQAPQELICNSIRQKNIPNPNACEAFTIGIILLQCMVSINCQYLYKNHFHSRCINWNAIAGLKRQIKNRYSHYLVKTVCQLLDQNPKSRKTLSQIHNQLQKNAAKSTLRKQMTLTNQTFFNNLQNSFSGSDNFEQTLMSKDLNTSQVIFNNSLVYEKNWNRNSQKPSKL